MLTPITIGAPDAGAVDPDAEDAELFVAEDPALLGEELPHAAPSNARAERVAAGSNIRVFIR
jgi:hypothetical protein